MTCPKYLCISVCCGLQVVLSRGGYTSAIDLWSLGCIFGEMLQRVAGLGAASTPQLQVAPMFAIQGKPKTPSEGCVYCVPCCWFLVSELYFGIVASDLRWRVSSKLPELVGKQC